jgi:hypothetical protein
MNMRERANVAARATLKALAVDADAKQSDIVMGIIEQAMIDAISEASKHSGEAVMRCCSPDLDIAHKLRQEVENANRALIANLSGMR